MTVPYLVPLGGLSCDWINTQEAALFSICPEHFPPFLSIFECSEARSDFVRSLRYKSAISLDCKKKQILVHQPIHMICCFATQTPDLQPLLLTMTSLKMRRNSRYMSLTYVEKLQNNTREIVIPVATLQVRFNGFVKSLYVLTFSCW